VAYPGTYALTRKDEGLSELVQRAGGVLGTGYLQRARLFRVQDGAGQANIVLEQELEVPGSRVDVMVQPGDSLHVPEYNPTVRVEGAVNTPVSVPYQEGASLGYYVENAGGYAWNADKGRVSVRYANGAGATVSRFLVFRSAPKRGRGAW